MLKKIIAISTVAVASSFAGLLTNGDCSYGDGGWYVWNNPDAPQSTLASCARSVSVPMQVTAWPAKVSALK